MLTSLHVKNFAVIEDEEINFEKGLNILTGETGAGKSVLLGSVGMALGLKTDKNLIRNGTDYALAELTFSLDPVRDYHIYEILDSEDIIPDNDSVTFTRKITKDRSTSRINGETVNNSIVNKIASFLLDIHGQNDSAMLLKNSSHMDLVDLFAGIEGKISKKEFADAFKLLRTYEKELSEADIDETEREHTLALLYHEIEEIENAALISGEDDKLEKEFELLKNGQKISEACGLSFEMLSGDQGAVEMLGRSLRELSSIFSLDDRLSDINDSITDAYNILEDASREIEHFLDRLEYDTERFSELESRLDLLNRLKSKYGGSIESIQNYLESAKEKAAKLEDHENYILKLRNITLRQKEIAFEKAETLSSVRKNAAHEFEKVILSNLNELNFPRVLFEIHIERLNEINTNGFDNIEFYISLNPGEEIKPLKNIASGGELSRIMLAVKTSLSDKDNIPTLIFDEIDSGISGITANKVAEKLQLIAKDRQVICITHLAQIAARSDHHFLIRKDIENERTSTHIIKLNKNESVNELARIIGGDQITENALKTAEELLVSGKRK